MNRSFDAGLWRPALIAAFLVIGLSAPALSADWQPITGSQTQTTPRPTPQPSGSGSGYGNIPTWGRGGGWSGEPDHPHPPVSTPAPAASASCGLRVDPQTAVAGDYVTVVATLSDSALRDFGRMDLLVGGQPVAGATRQGNSFSYAFRVPQGERQIDVSLTAYASRSDAYGQVRILCSAAASVAVLDLRLDAPKKVAKGQIFSAAASLDGGTPPYRFVWTPSGRIQDGGSESIYFNNFDSTGIKTISVQATDGAGRTLTRSARFEVVDCPAVTVSGTQQLEIGKVGTWTITFPSSFPPFRFQYQFGSHGPIHYSTNEKAFTFNAAARPGYKAVTVWAEDRTGCKSTASMPVRVTGAPIL